MMVLDKYYNGDYQLVSIFIDLFGNTEHLIDLNDDAMLGSSSNSQNMGGESILFYGV